MIKDINNVPKFLETLEELITSRIEIGILGEDGDKPSILMIARVHEYGTDIIPERSFLRASFDSRKKKFEEQGARLLKQVIVKGMSADAFFNAYGEYLVAQVRDYMVKLRYPANAPSTIKKKGSSNPLIDEGRLLGSIEWRVVKE